MRRDEKLEALVQAMADSCSFADEEETLRACWEKARRPLELLLQQVVEYAYFVQGYCEDGAFSK